MGNHHQMMMFNVFIHNLEVNMKSVLIRFGMTRISREVGTLTRGGCRGYEGLRRCPTQRASRPCCHGEPRAAKPREGWVNVGSWGGHHGFGPPKHGTSLALSAVEGCKRELGTPTPGPLHREALPRCSRVAGQGRNYEHGEGGWGSVCLVLGM